MEDRGALTSIFQTSAAASEREHLEETLLGCEAAARAAWPGVALGRDAFVARLSAIVRAEVDPVEALRALHASDLFLACACACGVPGALLALERAILARVPGMIAGVDRSTAFAQDVAQEVRETLLVPGRDGRTRIAGYSGRGSLAGYFRVVALRIARRLERERRCLEAGQPAARPVDPELDYLRVRYGRVFQAAFEGALRALPQRDRMLLRLHYVDGLNLDRLGAVYRIHRATVARWRAKIRRALLEKTRLLIRESVGMSDSEIESVFSVVRGDMGLNLRRALA